MKSLANHLKLSGFIISIGAIGLNIPPFSYWNCPNLNPTPSIPFRPRGCISGSKWCRTRWYHQLVPTDWYPQLDYPITRLGNQKWFARRVPCFAGKFPIEFHDFPSELNLHGEQTRKSHISETIPRLAGLTLSQLDRTTFGQRTMCGRSLASVAQGVKVDPPKNGKNEKLDLQKCGGVPKNGMAMWISIGMMNRQIWG